MPPIFDALELLTAQHEQIEDLFEQVRQIGDEAAFVELADKLATHVALEQELLYPAMQNQLAAEVMHELLAEHVAIRQVLCELVWLGTRDPDFRTKLERLGDLLVGHAAYQEDELFTTAAESMTGDELAALSEQIRTFDAIVATGAIAA
jgi:hemerythrin-like domain-containing protein